MFLTIEEKALSYIVIYHISYIVYPCLPFSLFPFNTSVISSFLHFFISSFSSTEPVSFVSLLPTGLRHFIFNTPLVINIYPSPLKAEGSPSAAPSRKFFAAVSLFWSTPMPYECMIPKLVFAGPDPPAAASLKWRSAAVVE